VDPEGDSRAVNKLMTTDGGREITLDAGAQYVVDERRG
jgi:hypothetical protein